MSTTREELERALAVAEHYARSEIVVALKTPSVNLVSLLHQRAERLRQEAIDDEELAKAVAYELQFDEVMW